MRRRWLLVSLLSVAGCATAPLVGTYRVEGGESKMPAVLDLRDDGTSLVTNYNDDGTTAGSTAGLWTRANNTEAVVTDLNGEKRIGVKLVGTQRALVTTTRPATQPSVMLMKRLP